ncbi:MAG: VPEID-CTERM sorting domain-containing protein [Rhodobacterales bacterium]
MNILNLSKIVSHSLTSAAFFTISASTVFAMGGHSARPEEAARLSAVVAPSQGGAVSGNVASVPEIDASSGLLAIAAVLAVVAFMWERKRRQRG